MLTSSLVSDCHFIVDVETLSVIAKEERASFFLVAVSATAVWTGITTGESPVDHGILSRIGSLDRYCYRRASSRGRTRILCNYELHSYKLATESCEESCDASQWMMYNSLLYRR